MMNKIKKIAFACAIILSSAGANAEFVKGDWKNTGDNLSIIDTETGVEWLSLTQTLDESILNIQNQLDSTYQGWRLPTQREVSDMFTYFTGVELTDMQRYQAQVSRSPAENMANMMGITACSNSCRDKFSRGLHLSDIEGLKSILYTNAVYSTFSDHKTPVSERIGNVYANIEFTNTMSWHSPSVGVYLVSDGGATLSSINDPTININNENAPINSVPLPATLGLLGLAMAGLSFRRKSA